MTMVWTLWAMFLATVLDLSAGIFIVYLMQDWFAQTISWRSYALGAFLGIAPDLDLIAAFFQKKCTGHHEYLTHRPIIGIPLAICLGWLFGGSFWAWTAGMIIVFHYLHK